jgi:anaerobic selenocysteine-containing dehydrogenase
VPVDKILEMAREYASADSAAIMWDLAVEQLPFSTLISYLIHAIAAMTGNVGKPGGNSWMESIAPPTLAPDRFDEPERAVASGIRSIASVGGLPMFSPTLVPEEVLVDHPERMRAMIVEASNPLLSYSDTSRWREACEALDLMVVIETAMTESARLADYVLPAPVGYEKWEMALFPKGYPEVAVQIRPPVVPGPAEALPEPEIYTRLAEAMGVVPPMPEALPALAENALDPEGAGAVLLTAMEAAKGMRAALVFWSYRTVGQHLPSPSLAAVWALCHENAMGRRESVLRTLGKDWNDASPFAIGSELFQRVLDHPEGVEIARVDPATNFDDNLGWEDGRVRMAPPELLAEVGRAIENDLPKDPEYPLVLGAGLRTRWTANTIQRHPEWRKGKGPHCPLHLAPDDATALGIASGDRVRISTRRGALKLPAEVDAKVRVGHVWIPNGFGALYPKNGSGELEAIGVNTNELTDVADRDPISGCPHHKYTLCRVERVA